MTGMRWLHLIVVAILVVAAIDVDKIKFVTSLSVVVINPPFGPRLPNTSPD